MERFRPRVTTSCRGATKTCLLSGPREDPEGGPRTGRTRLLPLTMQGGAAIIIRNGFKGHMAAPEQKGVKRQGYSTSVARGKGENIKRQGGGEAIASSGLSPVWWVGVWLGGGFFCFVLGLGLCFFLGGSGFFGLFFSVGWGVCGVFGFVFGGFWGCFFGVWWGGLGWMGGLFFCWVGSRLHQGRAVFPKGEFEN